MGPFYSQNGVARIVSEENRIFLGFLSFKEITKPLRVWSGAPGGTRTPNLLIRRTVFIFLDVFALFGSRKFHHPFDAVFVPKHAKISAPRTITNWDFYLSSR
jgi:hypothetical protein